VKRKTRPYRYDIGGVLSETAQLTGMGASIGGPVGAGIGAAVGLSTSLGKEYANTKFGQSKLGKVAGFGINPIFGVTNLIRQKKNREAQEAQNLLEQEERDYINKNSANFSKSLTTTYPTQGVPGVQFFNKGGLLKYNNGGNFQKLNFTLDDIDFENQSFNDSNSFENFIIPKYISKIKESNDPLIQQEYQRIISQEGTDDNIALALMANFPRFEDYKSTNNKLTSFGQIPGNNSVKPYHDPTYNKMVRRSFANGGNLSAPVSALGEPQMFNLSPGVTKFEGETHENGGIKLDTNGDGAPEAEVEDDEVMIDNRMILSDRLKPSKRMVEVLKNEGLSGDTYANIGEKIGKKLGALEEKLESGNNLSINTANIMTERLTAVLQSLFADQELTKPKTQNTQEFAKGGKLPKYFDGGYHEPTELDYYGDANQNVMGLNTIVGLNSKSISPLNTNINGKVPKTRYSQNFNFDTSIRKGRISNRLAENPPAFTPVNSPIKPSSNNLGFLKNINPYQVANVANYFLNERDINKLETDFEPELNRYTPFNYVDRSGLAKSENAVASQQAIDALDTVSPQSKTAGISAINAARLSGNNEINAAEAARRDQSTAQYSSYLTNINALNAETINRQKLLALERGNEQVALRTQNRNALIQGVLANQQNEQLMRMDGAKALLQAARSGNTGVVERLLNENPELREILFKGMSV
jgi:hypothetical protein